MYTKSKKLSFQTNKLSINAPIPNAQILKYTISQFINRQPQSLIIIFPNHSSMLKQNDDDFQSDPDNDSELSYNHKDDSYRGDSQANGLKETTEFFQKHGMFFCATCRNLMEPSKTKNEILEFKCRRCGIKPINFTGRLKTKSMVMCKSLQASARKLDLESKSIFDKSMPIMSINCPECSYDEAVYTVLPEEGERRIVVQLICARGAEESIVKCGHKWSLEQEKEIDEVEVEGALIVRGEAIHEEDD